MLSIDALTNALTNNDAEGDRDEFVFSEGNIAIETPLFTIMFHNIERHGIMVNGARALYLADIMNLPDRLTIRIATEMLEGQITLFGGNAVLDGTAPSFLQAFENGELKAEYMENLTSTQLDTLRFNYARISAYLETIDAIVKERQRLMPLSRRPVQYAWDTQNTKPINDFTAALRYRLQNNQVLKLLAQEREALTRKQQTGAVTIADLVV